MCSWEAVENITAIATSIMCKSDLKQLVKYFVGDSDNEALTVNRIGIEVLVVVLLVCLVFLAHSLNLFLSQFFDSRATQVD